MVMCLQAQRSHVEKLGLGKMCQGWSLPEERLGETIGESGASVEVKTLNLEGLWKKTES